MPFKNNAASVNVYLCVGVCGCRAKDAGNGNNIKALTALKALP
jgi:hypothetical protein